MAGCTRRRVAAAVDELALLHGPRWGDATLDRRSPGCTAAQPERPRRRRRPRRRTPSGVPRALHRPPRRRHVASPTGSSRASTATCADRPQPWTIVHGDFRDDNLMFGGDGGSCVVDWQTVGLGPGVADLSYFLGASLAPEDRRATRARRSSTATRRARARTASTLDRGRLLERLPPLRLRRADHGDRRLDARRPHRPRRRHVHGHGRAPRPPRPRPRLAESSSLSEMPKLTAMDEYFVHQIPEPLPERRHPPPALAGEPVLHHPPARRPRRRRHPHDGPLPGTRRDGRAAARAGRRHADDRPATPATTATTRTRWRSARCAIDIVEPYQRVELHVDRRPRRARRARPHVHRPHPGLRAAPGHDDAPATR